MRGKECRQYVPHLRPGITPAYAGKSKSRKCTQAEREDHPRVCGEKMCTVLAKDDKTGSPPRVRGKGCCGSSGT